MINRLMKYGSCLVITASAVSASLAQDEMTDSQPKEEQQTVDVQMKTSMGDIVLRLDYGKAPITVDNFLTYMEDKHFDGTIFHRIVPDFVVQGGGFTREMQQKSTRDGIMNEWENGLENKRGTISMARLGGRPDSGTSQFFLNLKDNAFLDQPRDGAGYAVFGSIIEGMDVLDKMGAVETTTKGAYQNVPVEPVVLETVTPVNESDYQTVRAEIKTVAATKVKELESLAAEASKAQRQAGIDYVKSQGVDVSGGTTTESGLWYVDEKVGDGEQPPAESTTVKVHYSGWLTDGKKFDSSYDRNQPIDFPLNRVIRGWTEGVGSMNVGSTRWLVIPPDLGYGKRGSPPVIPPDSVLVFKVELLELVQ